MTFIFHNNTIKIKLFSMTFHDPEHDYPGLENENTKFWDFPVFYDWNEPWMTPSFLKIAA